MLVQGGGIGPRSAEPRETSLRLAELGAELRELRVAGAAVTRKA